MGCCSIELSITNLVLLGAVVFGVKKLIKLFQKWKLEKMLDKWSEAAPRDKVLLHTSPRCKTLPSISPFAIKLETYLRASKIPYELETKDPMGPKGKLPWITYNGIHIADSHLIIQFLNKKFDINLDSGHSEEAVAVARACRILLEDHFLWGIVQYRWIENYKSLPQLMEIPTAFKFMLPIIRRNIQNRMISSGIGQHTPSEIYQMTEDDLWTVSKILGSKKFFAGETPSENDAAIFGMISQAVWAMPGSSCEKLVHGELKNLKEYCERMKHLYWPDWNECQDKS